MDSNSRNEQDARRLERCEVCNAVVAGWAEGSTICASCGMTLVEPPFEGCDYFDMIMRAGLVLWRAQRAIAARNSNLPY